MLALRMKIKMEAVGLMLMPGSTREDAEAELTEESVNKLKGEILDEWRADLKKANFELGDGTVDIELVEV